MLPFVLLISLGAAASVLTVQSLTADMAQVNIQQEVQDTSLVVRQSIPQFQSSYQLLVEQSGGFAPPVMFGPDGGFRHHFGSVLKLLPATPKDMAWRYGLHPDDGSAWAGMNYVCLQGPSVTPGNTLLGLRDALNMAHPGRTFLSDGCAMPGPAANPEQPSALTLYLVYTPPEEDSVPEAGTGADVPTETPGSAADPVAPTNPVDQGSGNGGGNGNGGGKDKDKDKDKEKEKEKEKEKDDDDEKGKGMGNGKGPDGKGPPGRDKSDDREENNTSGPSPWDDAGCKGKSPRCR